MNRRLLITAGICTLLSARAAFAQDVTIGYQGLPYKAKGESPTGIAVGEGMLLHVGAGAEVGYDSNVFYGNNTTQTGVIGSGILRVTSFASIGSATRTPGAGQPTGLTFDIRGGLTYRRYLSESADLDPWRNAIMPTAGLGLGYGQGRLSFAFSDSFVRLEDPPYSSSASSPLSRDANIATVEGRFSPGGGRLNFMLRYLNSIDYYETPQFRYGSSVTNQLTLDASWKWLPKTALFFQANQGYVTYLSQNTEGKVDSYPLRIVVGLRGLITPKTTANLSLGYNNGFYSSGATTNGIFGSTYLQAQLSVSPTLLSRVTVGVLHTFENSIISSFAYDDSIYASYVQQIAGRLAFDLSGRFGHRRYQGLLFPNAMNPTARTDNTVTVGATLDYFVRNWIYAGVGYSMVALLSDYNNEVTVTNMGVTTTELRSVEYTKHQVFARLGVTY